MGGLFDMGESSFYDRYATICKANGIDPCGKEIASILKIDKSTASSWNTNKTIPHGRIVLAIANHFHVSADYLLGRTEDITDPSKKIPVLTEIQNRLIRAFEKLDEADQAEVFQYIDFKAGQEKYKKAGITA